MASKTLKTTSKESGKMVPAKKPASSKARVAEKAKPVTRKKKAEKTVKTSPSKLRSSLTVERKKQVQDPVIPHEEIALRAYFIAERRHRMGWPGDPATDWADALKQLRAEALEKPLNKR